MSIRARVQEWLDNGHKDSEGKISVFTPAKSPLCSKRLVLKNLIQIHQLLEDESPYFAKERIKFLINDIENGKCDGGKL